MSPRKRTHKTEVIGIRVSPETKEMWNYIKSKYVGRDKKYKTSEELFKAMLRLFLATPPIFTRKESPSSQA